MERVDLAIKMFPNTQITNKRTKQQLNTKKQKKTDDSYSRIDVNSVCLESP